MADDPGGGVDDLEQQRLEACLRTTWYIPRQEGSIHKDRLICSNLPHDESTGCQRSDQAGPLSRLKVATFEPIDTMPQTTQRTAQRAGRCVGQVGIGPRIQRAPEPQDARRCRGQFHGIGRIDLAGDHVEAVW